jgi:hypothetical protein
MAKRKVEQPAASPPAPSPAEPGAMTWQAGQELPDAETMRARGDARRQSPIIPTTRENQDVSPPPAADPNADRRRSPPAQLPADYLANTSGRAKPKG